MSRLLPLALLALLVVNPGIRGQCPRTPVSPEETRKLIEHSLNAPVSIDFKEMPFTEAIDCLRDLLKLRIVVDQAALEEEGISLDRPITIKLDGISAKSALNLMLHQVHLSWLREDDFLSVTTERKARGPLLWFSYSIEDLLPSEAGYIDERWGDYLVGCIVNSVGWEQSIGGAQIECNLDCMTLVVSQTRDGHEQIQDLLDALRRCENPETSIASVVDR